MTTSPLDNLVLTPEIVRLVAEVDEWKGRWQAFRDLAYERLSDLRRVATIESVGSSTRIEGVKLRDDEVEELLAGLESRSFRSRDEQEVAGYAGVMEMVFESWREIRLHDSHFRQLHKELLRHAERDAYHRGDYKKTPNNVEAFDPDVRSLGVIFETASPFDTPRLMESLLAWTSTVLAERVHHPLLVIAVFVVRFLAIHPFQDGNGRLSRVVTTLLLLQAGYEYVPYSSLERVVEENKEDYYRALRRAQATLDDDESRLGEWIVFFLRCLVRQKDNLAMKLERENGVVLDLPPDLPPLAAEVIALVRRRGRLTISDIVTATGANRNTVKNHLRRLVEGGRLTRHGSGRGTWYEGQEG